MGGIFGGGSTSTTSTTKPELTEAQEGMLKTSGNIVQNFYNNLKGSNGELDEDDYQKLVAGLTPDQQTAIGQIRNVATSGDYKSGLDKALGMTEAASGAPDVSKFYNPYQQDVIDTTVAQLNKQTGQQQAALAAAQAGKKAFGSRADLATGQFLGDANNTLASTIANLQSSGYNTALGAAQNQQKQQLSAAGQYAQQVGQLQGGLLNTAQALQQSGATQQAQNQAAIDAPLTAAGRVSSISAGFPTGTSTTSTQPGANPFSQLLGLGLTAASFFKDGGMASGGTPKGWAVDPAEWASVPTEQIKYALGKLPADDPDRTMLAEVYSQRVRDEGSRAPTGAAEAGLGAGLFGAGEPNPAPYAAGQVPGVLGIGAPPAVAQDDAPNGLGLAAAPIRSLPTNMSGFSPEEIAAGQQFKQMKAASARPGASPAQQDGDSFLGAAPAFDLLDLGQPQGGDPGLSYGGKPSPGSKFPELASAISDLIGATTPQAATGAGLGGGRSLRPVQVRATPASAPAPVQGIGAAQAVAPEAANGNTPAAGGGWLSKHLDGALDNPLLYIGLGIMASKDHSLLGALGEGAASGIGAYSGRRQKQQELAMQGAKNAQDVSFEQQKLAIQQAVAEGQLTADQGRLALAKASASRQERALGKPSSIAEKMQYLDQLGATPEEKIRALGAADTGQMDERTKFLTGWMGKNPGADISDGMAVWDQIQASGASDDDLKAAAGF